MPHISCLASVRNWHRANISVHDSTPLGPSATPTQAAVRALSLPYVQCYHPICTHVLHALAINLLSAGRQPPHQGGSTIKKRHRYPNVSKRTSTPLNRQDISMLRQAKQQAPTGSYGCCAAFMPTLDYSTPLIRQLQMNYRDKAPKQHSALLLLKGLDNRALNRLPGAAGTAFSAPLSLPDPNSRRHPARHWRRSLHLLPTHSRPAANPNRSTLAPLKAPLEKPPTCILGRAKRDILSPPTVGKGSSSTF